MTISSRHLQLAGLAVTLLFFLDLGAAFVEAGYAFGLLATNVPPAVGLVALAFLSPLLLLPLRRELPHTAFLGVTLVAFGCRLAEPMLQKLARVIVAGTGFAALWIVLLLWIRHARGLFAAALALACGAAALFRVQGIDASRELPFVTLALAALALAGAARRPEETPTETASFGRTLVLVLGLTCALALALAAFMAPGVIARWFFLSHASAHAIFALSWTAALALLAWWRWSRLWLPIATLVFAGTLTAALLLVQPALPSAMTAYPWQWVPPTGVRVLPLIALALSGTVPLAVAALVGELAAEPRKLAGAFAIGGVVLLLLVAAQILTTIYDYAPVVGPLFRNRFWLVTAVPAFGLAGALWLVREAPSGTPRGALIPMVVLGVATVIGSRMTEPRPTPNQRLRVVSYNIQQGYAADGRKALEAQLAILRQLDADVVGLQECDTSRLAGANTDTVRYLARALGMHAYYGPPPPTGTFGVALLSRHPIMAVATHYLYSTGEQTAVVVAELAIGDEHTTVAVTHLGNDGPIVQQQNLLAALPARRIAVMGDFNFVRGSPQHRLTTERLSDEPAVANAEDLDHLFTSAELRVREKRYLRDPASDHPALFAELDL